MTRKRKFDPVAHRHLTHVTAFHPELTRALATVGATVHVPQGWSIMVEKRPADSVYVLLDGDVEIRKAGEVLRTLGPGDMIGEIALLSHTLRSASVIALTDVTALRVEDSAVRALSDMDPRFAEALRSTAERRLQPS